MNIHLLYALFFQLDHTLPLMIAQYGLWSYVFITLIIFLESACILTPFLPGDALLFSVGSLSAMHSLNFINCFILLVATTSVGYQINYHVGRYTYRYLKHTLPQFVKPRYLQQTQNYFKRYGKSALILARFVPIVRTFAPFLAGFSNMKHAVFLKYNLVGTLLWISIGLGAGYCFGQIHFVQQHFSLIILGIVLVSLLPALYHMSCTRQHNEFDF